MGPRPISSALPHRLSERTLQRYSPMAVGAASARFIVPIPDNEAGRISALHACGILDTPPEAGYDELTDVAARLFGCPVSYIKFFDRTRAWFKSKVGFPPEMTEVPREMTICNSTICQADLVVIPDLAADERFHDRGSSLWLRAHRM